jgi:hypothetical protein
MGKKKCIEVFWWGNLVERRYHLKIKMKWEDKITMTLTEIRVRFSK